MSRRRRRRRHLGLPDQSLHILRHIYDERVERYGASAQQTLKVANQLACVLNLTENRREAQKFLRERIPLAERRGADGGLTLMMRQNLGAAL